MRSRLSFPLSAADASGEIDGVFLRSVRSGQG